MCPRAIVSTPSPSPTQVAATVSIAVAVDDESRRKETEAGRSCSESETCLVGVVVCALWSWVRYVFEVGGAGGGTRG